MLSRLFMRIAAWFFGVAIGLKVIGFILIVILAILIILAF